MIARSLALLPAQSEPPVAVLPDRPAEVATGSAFSPEFSSDEIFQARCAMCHGRAGAGNGKLGRRLGARDVTSAKWQASRTDAQVREAITDGRPNSKMRAFGALGTPDQFDGLVARIRAFAASSDSGAGLP